MEHVRNKEVGECALSPAQAGQPQPSPAQLSRWVRAHTPCGADASQLTAPPVFSEPAPIPVPCCPPLAEFGPAPAPCFHPLAYCAWPCPCHLLQSAMLRADAGLHEKHLRERDQRLKELQRLHEKSAAAQQQQVCVGRRG